MENKDRPSHPVQMIDSLQPFQWLWTIKCKVIQRGDIYSYTNSKGSGALVKMILMDDEGSKIQAIMYNETIKHFEDTLEQGKTYYISNGMVKGVNASYRSIHNKYEICLETQSQVIETKEDDAKQVPYRFVKTNQLRKHISKGVVDVIAMVVDVKPCSEIRRKSDGKIINKRDITIIDTSAVTVLLTLWEEIALNEGEELMKLVEEKPIIIVTSLNVTNFNGCSLSTTKATTLLINIETIETEEIRNWSLSEDFIDFKPSSQQQISTSVMDIEEVSLKYILDCQHSALSEATITGILNKEEPWYTACIACKSKVNVEAGNTECSKCNIPNTDYIMRYQLQMKIKDRTTEASITSFDNESKYILGHAVDRLKRIKEEESGSNEFYECMKMPVGREFTFLIKSQDRGYKQWIRRILTVHAIKKDEDVIDGEPKIKKIKVEKE